MLQVYKLVVQTVDTKIDQMTNQTEVTELAQTYQNQSDYQS